MYDYANTCGTAHSMYPYMEAVFEIIGTKFQELLIQIIISYYRYVLQLITPVKL